MAGCGVRKCIKMASCGVRKCIKMAGCGVRKCIKMASCGVRKCIKMAGCGVRKCIKMAGCGVRKCAHFGRSLLICDLFFVCAQVDSECGNAILPLVLELPISITVENLFIIEKTNPNYKAKCTLE
jgi:hypothetical protein